MKIHLETVKNESLIYPELVHLWRAVIKLAISDAYTPNYSISLHQQKALNWLSGTADFFMVCDLAGVLPKDVWAEAEKCRIDAVRLERLKVSGKRNYKPHKRKERSHSHASLELA